METTWSSDPALGFKQAIKPQYQGLKAGRENNVAAREEGQQQLELLMPLSNGNLGELNKFRTLRSRPSAQLAGPGVVVVFGGCGSRQRSLLPCGDRSGRGTPTTAPQSPSRHLHHPDHTRLHTIHITPAKWASLCRLFVSSHLVHSSSFLSMQLLLLRR